MKPPHVVLSSLLSLRSALHNDLHRAIENEFPSFKKHSVINFDTFCHDKLLRNVWQLTQSSLLAFYAQAVVFFEAVKLRVYAVVCCSQLQQRLVSLITLCGCHLSAPEVKTAGL
jgi:hypothetical protein